MPAVRVMFASVRLYHHGRARRDAGRRTAARVRVRRPARLGPRDAALVDDHLEPVGRVGVEQRLVVAVVVSVTLASVRLPVFFTSTDRWIVSPAARLLAPTLSRLFVPLTLMGASVTVPLESDCDTVAEFVNTANAPMPTSAAATVTSEIDSSTFVPRLRRRRVRARRPCRPGRPVGSSRIVSRLLDTAPVFHSLSDPGASSGPDGPTVDPGGGPRFDPRAPTAFRCRKGIVGPQGPPEMQPGLSSNDAIASGWETRLGFSVAVGFRRPAPRAEISRGGREAGPARTVRDRDDVGTTVSDEGQALSGAESTRVLVVDDHRMFTELLAHLLDGYDDIELVGVATTADEALAFAAADPPDVAVIDYRLPGEDGARVAARFKAAHPSVKLVMLTGFDDDEVLRSAITAGCSGFVTKDRAAEDLVSAVRAVRSGAPALDPEAVNRLIVAPAPERRGALRSLTSRELDVLELLVEGISTRGIAERLFVSVNTARNHVQRVLAKLGVHSRLEAVALASREGLVRHRDT